MASVRSEALSEEQRIQSSLGRELHPIGSNYVCADFQKLLIKRESPAGLSILL